MLHSSTHMTTENDNLFNDYSNIIQIYIRYDDNISPLIIYFISYFAYHAKSVPFLNHRIKTKVIPEKLIVRKQIFESNKQTRKLNSINSNKIFHPSSL